MAGMMAMMKRMMGGNNNHLFYNDHPNPMSQFLSVVMKRKEAFIDSDPEIKDAIAHRVLTVRGTFHFDCFHAHIFNFSLISSYSLTDRVRC
jgi:hypothetical protein